MGKHDKRAKPIKPLKCPPHNMVEISTVVNPDGSKIVYMGCTRCPKRENHRP